MTMTIDEVRQRMAEAQQAYQGEDWSRAADMFAELLTEPEALSGANEMHWNLAMCFAHLDNFELAMEHIRAGGWEEQQFRDAVRQSNLRDARHDWEQAQQLFQNEQWDDAAQAFAELALHPGYPSDQVAAMHWNMAMCFAHLDNFELAMEHIRAGGWDEQQFRDALRQANLRDARHDYEEAVELYRDERWEQAADAFAELVLHPGYPSDQVAAMHWNMAMCFAHLGNVDLALEHVRAGGHDEAEFRRTAEQQGITLPAPA